MKTYLIKQNISLDSSLGILRDQSGACLLERAQVDFLMNVSLRPLFPCDLQAHPWLRNYVVEDKLNRTSKKRRTFIESELSLCKREEADYVAIAMGAGRLTWGEFKVDVYRTSFLFRTNLLDGIDGEYTLSFFKRWDFNRLRDDWILNIISRKAIQSVVDLGCGTTSRLRDRLQRFNPLVSYAGVDQVDRGDGITANFLSPTFELPPAQACVLEEVIEHLRPEELDELMRKVAGQGFRDIIITTPHRTYSKFLGTLFRHPDHKFEWNEHQLRNWLGQMSARHGFRYFYRRIGRSYKGHAPSWGIYLWRT